MKEHVQDYGVRKWAGDDLIELQAEPLSALQALVAPYAPCILTGCELETVPDGNGDYRLHAGYVALKGRKTVDNGAGTDTDTSAEGTENGSDAGVAAATADNGETTAEEEYVKIVRVSAQTVKQPTVFLTLACTPLSRAYGNGENKAIAYDYTAEVCDVLSDVGDRPYLTLVADAKNPCLLDTLGITKKLDREDGEAKDVVVTFTDDGGKDAPEDLQSGLTLGLLISRIKKWLGKKLNTVGGEAKDVVVTFTDDGGKDAPEDLQSGLTLGLLISRIKKWLGKKVDKKDGYELSKNDFTNELKTKLDNFTHPAGGDLTGSYPNPTIKSSVGLTGNPTAPTPGASDNSTRIATTSHVHSYASPLGHQHGELIDIPDTRNVIETPNSYNGGFYVKGIKNSTRYGIPSSTSGEYVQVFGYRGWSDNSGGYAHEFALTDKGYMFHRVGQATNWSAWKAFAHFGEITWGSITGKPSLFTPASHTHDNATSSKAGFMSATDKSKLENIDSGAQVNSITGIKGNAENTYRVGNVNLTPENIGAAQSAHSHNIASASESGFISAADKSKLNGFVNGFRVTVNGFGGLRLIWKDTTAYGAPEVYVDLSGKTL